jgi:hypothetical protein
MPTHTVAHGAQEVILVWQDLEKRTSLRLMEHDLSFEHQSGFIIEKQQFNSQ